MSIKNIKPETRFQLIGEITGLMLHSKVHNNFQLKDLRDFVLPPVELNQFRIYRNRKNLPVAFITWAKVSDEIEKKFLYEKYNLKPDEWNCGNKIIFIDFVAPFGHVKQVVKDLKCKIFPGEVGRYLRFGGLDGGFRKICLVRGKGL